MLAKLSWAKRNWTWVSFSCSGLQLGQLRVARERERGGMVGLLGELMGSSWRTEKSLENKLRWKTITHKWNTNTNKFIAFPVVLAVSTCQLISVGLPPPSPSPFPSSRLCVRHPGQLRHPGRMQQNGCAVKWMLKWKLFKCNCSESRKGNLWAIPTTSYTACVHAIYSIV